MSNTCCGAIEMLARDYDLPFTEPLYIDKEDHSIKRGGWHIRLNKLTKSGNLSKRGCPLAQVTFCPFCGTRLVEQPQQEGGQ